MFHAIAVIVLIGSGAKLYFLDCDCYLLLLRLIGLFLGFVLKLAKINDAADRRIGAGSDFNQIESLLPRGANGVTHVHYAKLFTFLPDDAHLRHANSFVNTHGRQAPVVRALTATSKACSYCCTSSVTSQVQVPTSNVRSRNLGFGLRT